LFYADPGSGLLVWQLIIALFLGATFSVSKLKTWIVSKLKSTSGTSESGNAPSSEQHSSKAE